MKFRQLVFIRSAIPLVNHRIIPNKNPPTFFNLEYLSVGRSLESTESLNRHTVDTVSAHQDHSATELQGAISTPSIHLNPDPWVSTLEELLLRSLFGLDFMQRARPHRNRRHCHFWQTRGRGGELTLDPRAAGVDAGVRCAADRPAITDVGSGVATNGRCAARWPPAKRRAARRSAAKHRRIGRIAGGRVFRW